MRCVRFVPVVLAAALVLGACGSDDSSSGTGSTAGSAAPAASSSGSEAPATTGAAAASTGTLVLGDYCQTDSQFTSASPISYGDCKKMADAMVNYINSNGGAGGRQVQLVQVITDLEGQTPPDQQQQAACATFTEDNHADVVVSNVVNSSVLYECLGSKGVPLFAGSALNPDSSFYEKYPTLYGVPAATDRVGATMVELAVAEGWWAPDTKVGLVTTQFDWDTKAAAAFNTQAGTHNLKVTDQISVCSPCDPAQQGQELSSGILKFKSQGIDHVAVIASGPFFAYTAAEVANQYFPQLLLNSEDALFLASAGAKGDAAKVWPGAIAVGMYPTPDVADPHSLDVVPPRQEECGKTLADGGQPLNDPLKEWQGAFLCDIFYLFKDTLDASKGKSDAASIQTAVEGLGDSYQPAGTWSAKFGPGRHDGTDTYRVLKYDTSCSCFKYSSAPQPMVQKVG
jgi:ABC-type branched-subunit amino acid transport system substrate-binding protein